MRAILLSVVLGSTGVHAFLSPTKPHYTRKQRPQAVLEFGSKVSKPVSRPADIARPEGSNLQGSLYFGSSIKSAGNAMYIQQFTETTRDQSIGFVYGCVNANKLAAKVTFVDKRRLKEVQARKLAHSC